MSVLFCISKFLAPCFIYCSLFVSFQVLSRISIIGIIIIMISSSSSSISIKCVITITITSTTIIILIYVCEPR